jgi:hypothetical protein
MEAGVLEADYVVVGAGACGMSFADVILTESDRTVALVDRHAQPGGHWNDAYPFVRLHAPSSYYGVNSRMLGRQERETAGRNAGLFEMATGGQVLSYFEEVMREQFLPTGRVTYLPMSEYLPDGTVVSAVTGRKVQLVATRRVVDARYLGSAVPSVQPPSFRVADGVAFCPINGLAEVTRAPSGYVVLGGGKTGVDACLWLLDHGVDAARITWVRPRDAWFLNRARIQPDVQQLYAYADLLEASVAAGDLDDLLGRLEHNGVLLRIDAACWPTMFRGATATVGEMALLGAVDRVVRRGHVTAIEPGVVHLEDGDLETGADWLHVDCTAEGLRRRPPIPIFQHDRITLQYVVLDGHPTYSAALIARIELALDDDAEKNDVCPPEPVLNQPRDVAGTLLAELEGEQKWAAIPGLSKWIDTARLNPAVSALAAVQPTDDAAQAAVGRILERAAPARDNLRRLLAATA